MRLPSAEEYCGLSRNDKVSLCHDVESTCRDSFEFVELGKDEDKLPTFRHKSADLHFKLILPGTVRMGLSEAEEQAARSILDPPPINFDELRPVQETDISGFFLSRTPILYRDFYRLRNELPASDRYLNYPAYVQFDDAFDFAQKLDCPLPSEAEWEYACRGTTKTLFVFGDTLPDDVELASWLQNDFAGESAVKCNSFGLQGLFAGEFCRDAYRPTHSESSPDDPDVHVVKGGGAFFWPWQDQEWVWCMPAMRLPSTHTIDGEAAFRLSYRI